MEISWIRIYLLAGLLLHKAVWDFMKAPQRKGAAPPKVKSTLAQILSTVKVAILLGVIAQTLLPVMLPLAADPSTLALPGVVLFTIGLAVALTGRIQLGRNWTDIEKSYVRDEHRLVSHGLYHWVRHPIYTGDVLLLLGLELALNSWFVLGVAAIAVYVRRQAIHEEAKLKQSIPDYDRYCERTSRFVPFLSV
jgi:protein-S-isoprenylcysteine O-methyltransferase Ste14